MNRPFTAGSVWEDQIQFPRDSEPRKKFYVLLHDEASPGEPLLAAITTSKGNEIWGYQPPSPCGSPSQPYFRIKAGEEACFQLDTWIQFDNPVRGLTADGLAAKMSRHARYLQHLKPDRLRALLNCAKKSEDLAQIDVDRISATLKLLASAKPAPKPPSPLEAIRLRLAAHRDECVGDFHAAIARPDCSTRNVVLGAEACPDDLLDVLKEMIALLEESECGCASKQSKQK